MVVFSFFLAANPLVNCRITGLLFKTEKYG